MSDQGAAVSPPNWDQVSLTDVFSFLRQNFLLVVIVAAIVGTLSFGAAEIFIPRLYQASAVLVIVPSTFSSELTPQTLSVQAYQMLLESDAVVAETKRRLVEQQVIGTASILRVGGNLGSRILVSKRSEDKELAPMIEVRAKWKIPEEAASITNTWAEVFLERARELRGGATIATVEFIDEQYPQFRDELFDLEDERIRLEKYYQGRFNAEATARAVQIASWQNETAVLVAEFGSESERLATEFSGEQEFMARKAQLTALQRALEELEDERSLARAKLARGRIALTVLSDQLEQISPVVRLRKAISDEALWGAVVNGKADEADLEKLRESQLISEQVNPVFIQIAKQAATAETTLRSLESRVAQLEDQRTAMASQLRELDLAFGRDQSERGAIEGKRSAGLIVLGRNRQVRLEDLEREKAAALASITMEWETRIEQLERDIGVQDQLFGEIASNFNQGALARAQSAVADLRLGAPAVKPDKSLPRHTGAKGVIGALAGAVLGIFLGLVRVPRARAR